MKDHLGPWLPLRKGSLSFWVRKSRQVLQYFDLKKQPSKEEMWFYFLFSALFSPWDLSAVPGRSLYSLQGCSKALELPWERKSRLRETRLRTRTWGQRRAGVPTEQSCVKPSWSQLGSLFHSEVLYQRPWGKRWQRTPLALNKLLTCGEDLCRWPQCKQNKRCPIREHSRQMGREWLKLTWRIKEDFMEAAF